jgi:hypothetical protein
MLLCFNADGSEKLRPLVDGTAGSCKLPQKNLMSFFFVDQLIPTIKNHTASLDVPDSKHLAY